MNGTCKLRENCDKRQGISHTVLYFPINGLKVQQHKIYVCHSIRKYESCLMQNSLSIVTKIQYIISNLYLMLENMLYVHIKNIDITFYVFNGHWILKSELHPFISLNLK